MNAAVRHGLGTGAIGAVSALGLGMMSGMDTGTLASVFCVNDNECADYQMQTNIGGGLMMGGGLTAAAGLGYGTVAGVRALRHKPANSTLGVAISAVSLGTVMLAGGAALFRAAGPDPDR